MQYETFKAWALRQNWIEVEECYFVTPNARAVHITLNDNTIIGIHTSELFYGFMRCGQ